MDKIEQFLSPTLLGVFKKVDSDYKKLNTALSGHSIYFKVGCLKVRVSDHLKKSVDDLEEGSINLVRFPGSRSYLIGMKGSVYMNQCPIKYIEDVLRAEIYRLQYFFPDSIQSFAEPVKFSDVPPEVKSCGLEKKYMKYCVEEDVRRYSDMAQFGDLVKCIYGELKIKYKSGTAKKIYQGLTGKTSYSELKEYIKTFAA